MINWGWRTKPRSILKTIEWLKFFKKFEGEKWDETNGEVSAFKNKPIHPIRRKYYYYLQQEEEYKTIPDISYYDYLSGKYDKTETESNARQDKTTFEFFGLGYVDSNGIIKITDAGNKILSSDAKGEFFLKQLLKMNYPSLSTGYGRNIPNNHVVFPMEILLNLLNDLKFIYRFELSFSYLCLDSKKEYSKLLKAIKEFRKRINALDVKKESMCKKIFLEVSKKYYNMSDKNKINSFFTISDAFCRALEFTGFFSTSGRGDLKKIRVSKTHIDEFNMLINKYEFVKSMATTKDEYMEWFGNLSSTTLPWEKESEQISLIRNKLNLFSENIKKISDKYKVTIPLKTEIYEKKLNNTHSMSELKILEQNIVKSITTLNEEVFIKYLYNDSEIRRTIIEKFDEIIDGTTDDRALWLENNTWKSLVSLDGVKEVKRNFSIEEDLSPKYYAPGVGNTPDMEMVINNSILVPEVSLMSGKKQWEHEGSSVVDHVIKFINNNKEKNVIGMFIAQKIYSRTLWQFFILNKTSWVGTKVPIVPLTIEQYKSIISFMYDKNIEAEELVNLLNKVHESSLKIEDYNVWENDISSIITNWKSNYA